MIDSLTAPKSEAIYARGRCDLLAPKIDMPIRKTDGKALGPGGDRRSPPDLGQDRSVRHQATMASVMSSRAVSASR